MTAAEGSAHAPVLDRVKGQPGVLGLLRGALRAPLHAYLFIGPPGSGRLDASIAFAAALLCPRAAVASVHRARKRSRSDIPISR